MKFLEIILIFTTVKNSRHDENKMEERIIIKAKLLVEGRRSEISDQKLSKRLKVNAAIGQRFKNKDQRPQVG